MNKRIQDMVDKLKADPNGIYTLLIYRLSWSTQGALSDNSLPCIRESIDSCAKMHNWTIHKSSIDNKHISFVVQIDDPDISAEHALHTFQKFLKMSITRAFPVLKNKCLWADDALIETMDPSELA